MRTALIGMGILYLRRRLLGDDDPFVMVVITLVMVGFVAAIIQDYLEITRGGK